MGSNNHTIKNMPSKKSTLAKCKFNRRILYHDKIQNQSTKLNYTVLYFFEGDSKSMCALVLLVTLSFVSI